MIKKVTLKNFQAHKNLELEFGKFTTLTGGSNGGKSAVLRALIALARNDSANDYLRHGQKTLSVKIEFEDGNKVEWIKGSGENKYIVTDPDGDQLEFDKVGANVPEEVQAVLKFGPLAVGKDKHYINFHQQLEPPFLISATPGDVAKLFGELTSASQLYSAVNEGNRGVRATNAQKKTRMGDLRQTKIDLEDFDAVEDEQKQLDAVKWQLIEARNKSVEVTDLTQIGTSLKETNNKISDLSSKVGPLEDASKVNLDELIDVGAKAQLLDGVVKRIKKLETTIERGKNGEKAIKASAAVDLSALEEATRSAVQLSELHTDITGLDRKIEDAQQGLEAVEKQMEEDAARYNDLIEQVDDCPWCESELSAETKAALLGKVVSNAGH